MDRIYFRRRTLGTYPQEKGMQHRIVRKLTGDENTKDREVLERQIRNRKARKQLERKLENTKTKKGRKYKRWE